MKTQMSQLVIQYNEKFVKGIYLGDLLYKVMCINTKRITVFSLKWNPVRFRFIFLNTVRGNIAAFGDMETHFYQGTTVLFFHQDEKRLKAER